MFGQLSLQGHSKDNQEAFKILKDSGLKFSTEHSEYKNKEPVLIVEDCAYAFKGLQEIKEHIHSLGFPTNWADLDFIFFKSNYLSDIRDIWKLEFLLGKEPVFRAIQKESLLCERIILSMFKDSYYKFFTNEDRSILSSSNNELFKTQIELNMRHCLQTYGIDFLVEVKEKGYIEI